MIYMVVGKKINNVIEVRREEKGEMGKDIKGWGIKKIEISEDEVEVEKGKKWMRNESEEMGGKVNKEEEMLVVKIEEKELDEKEKEVELRSVIEYMWGKK